jgi:riboflavin kinase / FMN adenylyltransferase
LPAPAVALGNFDGVHLGHRELIARAKHEAAQRAGTSVLYTFEPHPVRILSPEQCPPLLCTLEQKLALLEATGIDVAVIEPFTAAFSREEPAHFFEEVIRRRLHAAAVIIGYDFTFGRHRLGTIETFEALGRGAGIEIVVVPAVFAGETLVSSTVIRNMVRAGDVAGAAALLGRAYEIEGTVVPGRGMGAKLSARTANLQVRNELVPHDGIYLTTTRVGTGEWTDSITSIGVNPTFPDVAFTVETHLIDRDADLAGQPIAVAFLAHMREQRRFPSAEALAAQIARDIAQARDLHRRRRGC